MQTGTKLPSRVSSSWAFRSSSFNSSSKLSLKHDDGESERCYTCSRIRAGDQIRDACLEKRFKKGSLSGA